MAWSRHYLRRFGCYWNSIANSANHTISSSCRCLFLQKFNKNVQLAVEQQMVRKLHKKLQRGQRPNVKNKVNCFVCVVDNYRFFNNISTEPSLTNSVGFANTINNAYCCNWCKYPSPKTANIQTSEIKKISRVTDQN